MTTPVTTILGKPLADDYGTVLAHEHVFIDIRCWADVDHPLYARLKDQRVSEGNVEEVRRDPFACLDNIVLDDVELAVAEVGALPEGSLLVDVTPDELGGDREKLAEVSRRTGVDIITGGGYYIADAWRERHGDEPVSWFVDHILRDFEGPRPASVIGEIGTSGPIAECERRSLAGAAIAQRETGAPLYVHLHPWDPDAMAALDIVEANGGDLSRTVLCHCDVTAKDSLDAMERLLRRGCYLGFDIWGDECQYGDVSMPTDRQRAECVAELARRGWAGRMVHAQDVCTKTQLRRWHGAGYDHVARDMPRLLAEAGMSEADIALQTHGNMMRLLRGE